MIIAGAACGRFRLAASRLTHNQQRDLKTRTSGPSSDTWRAALILRDDGVSEKDCGAATEETDNAGYAAGSRAYGIGPAGGGVAQVGLEQKAAEAASGGGE